MANSRVEQGRKSKKTIIDFFANNPHWIDIKTLTNITGINGNSVRIHCMNLTMEGYLEEAKLLVGVRKIIHYRRRG
ncbi:MAG: hypothetical protein HC930_02425 [Hydrococcus sp. SU_1_0]|nr:hypothetical protein [Hydrococcus sp. SU_1_0]